MWSIPAAIRSPLCLVRWTSVARRSWTPWYSPTSGARSAAAARGSSVSPGTGSLATSSDCTTMRAARLERLDLVADRRDRALDEGHEPRRADAHALAGGRDPLDLAAQHAVAQVEHALVPDQPPVAHVERLVVDEQPDQLAVGDVDDRLALLGVAVAGLRVGQRALLEERVEERAGRSGGLALVEVAAQADVPVGQREDRLALRQQLVAQLALAHEPGLDRKDLLPDHPGVISSSRSSTTTSAPRRLSASA